MRRKILTIALSSILVLALVLISVTGCVPKKSTTTTTPTSSSTSTSQLEGRIAALESTVSSLANKQSGASQTDVDALKVQVNTLTAENASLKQLLETVDAQLQEILAEEEEQQQTEEDFADTDPEDAISTDTRYPPTVTFTEAVNPGEIIQVLCPIQLKLYNELPIDIEDILLSLNLVLRPSTGLVITDTEITGDIEWFPYGLDNFQSWDDISLKASDRESYQLLLTVSVTNNTTSSLIGGNVRISVRAYCDDFEIA